MIDMKNEIKSIKSEMLGDIDKIMARTAQDEIKKYNHAPQMTLIAQAEIKNYNGQFTKIA